MNPATERLAPLVTTQWGGALSRPEVTLDNYEAVYRFYEGFDQPKAFARFAHLVFAKVFRLDLSFEEGADEEIREALASGVRVVISPNHITGDDQYVIVALAQHLKALHPLRGNTFIPAEPSLFIRKGIMGRLLRWAVDGLGAVPTIRMEDLRRQKVEITPEVEDRYRNCTTRASDVQVSKLQRGQMMAGFWEGTRNRTDYRVVQPLKKGMAFTAIAAAETVPVAILPVGFYYGSEPEDYKRPDVPGKRRPHVHVGHPIPVETTDAVTLVAQVHPAIQQCVDVVVARAEAVAATEREKV